MKNRILAILCVAVLFGCGNNTQDDNLGERQNMISEIDSLQQDMFNTQNMKLDEARAAKGIQMYQNFVAKYPNDSLSAEYLFRSSDLSRALGNNLKSIELLSQVCVKYPNYKKIPDCLFLQGYYYQEFFNDTAQARNFYTQLLSKYPNHAFADDARALMQMFGKSEQDIIDGFEKKGSEQNSSTSSE